MYRALLAGTTHLRDLNSRLSIPNQTATKPKYKSATWTSVLIQSQRRT